MTTLLLWFAAFAITQVLACTPAVNQTKRCDDGNDIDGDGCSRTCQVEIGWKCPPSEIVGDCECYCINRNSAGELLTPPCLCDWKQSGTGAPLPQMADFERVGFAFELADRNKMMQGFRFVRSGCQVDKTWEQRDTASGPCPTGTPADWEENEGLTLQVAANRKVSGKTDYDPANAVYVQWVGSPIRQVTSLERLAFECPPGMVPTSIYFEKGGCNALSNFSTYAWATKIDLERRPGCMANSQDYNDGLTFVAECRPDPTLARGMWQWIDAGLKSPVVYPSDLADLGGLCPDGEVMTGAYFNAAGCGENLKWNQQLVGSDITPKCIQGQTNPDGSVSRNGLNLRLKCTKYGAREHFECGPKASRAEKPCDAMATCQETKDDNSTVIATRCVCNQGYEGTGRRGDCFVIDHCANQTSDCAPAPGGVCTYTGPGTYTCACRQGYTGDGKTCVQTRRINDSPIVFPNFKAQCTFGGKPGSTVSGGFTLTTQRNSVGDPVGTKFEAELAGAGLAQVATYDIYEFSVDTTPYLDACWDAGRQFKRPNPGLTLKNGLLRANMVFYDASLYIMTDQAANNILGRSIVLKDRTLDVVECCTIHLVGESVGTPADPTWVDTANSATCVEEATGRQVSFTQLTPQIGTPRDLEDNYGGGSVGSRIRANHETPIVKTTFASASDNRNWRDNRGQTPTIESCSGLRLLGGTSSLGAGRWIQYNIPSTRVFRSATVKFTYHALGSWENEFARVEVVTGGRTPLTFSIWERTILSTGACSSTRNRFPQEIEFHLDHPQKDGVAIRFSSGLDGRGGSGGESFAISRFELVLEPTVLSTPIRNRPFTGASDLNSWTQVRANGQRFFPSVETCDQRTGTDYNLLGGFMDIKNGDFLRYEKKGVRPFTRVQADFTFFFNKAWDGQTATLDLIRLNSAGAEVERVKVWERTTTAAQIRASSINCGNQALNDLRVPVSATGTISQLATVLRMEFKVGGKTLPSTASWAIGSWTVRTLSTDQSEVFYQDRFRNYITSAGAATDFKLIVNGRVTNIGNPPAKGSSAANNHDQWTYCQGSQSARRYPFSFKIDDRTLRGWRGQDIRYSESRMRPFTKALITFDVFMLEVQDQTITANVDGLGIVWRFAHGRNMWWRARCTTGGRNGGVGQHVKDVSVYLTFPSPRTSLTITWSTNAASTDRRIVSFGLAAFKAELLPSDDQLAVITETTHSNRFTYGIPQWGSGSQSFIRTPWLEESERTFANSGGINPIRDINHKCVIPNSIKPNVGDAADTAHTLLGYRLGRYQVLRYKNTTPRPYTKAIVSYYFWNLDSWNSVSVDPNHGERGYLRQKAQVPLQSAFPMRYLMSETYDKTEFFAPFCGNVPFTNTNFPDYVKYNANTMLETSATTNIDLFWGTSLNGDASNEGFAISRLQTILFPEIPGTYTVVRYTAQQFTTADAQRGQYTFDGTTRPPVLSCASVGTQALQGAANRNDRTRTIRFDSGNLATPFISLRIHFRFFYLGDWNGERATLHLLGLSSGGSLLESRSIWRGDWRYWGSNDIPHGNPGRLTTTMGRVCDQVGRARDSVADWYQDVFVEGTFQSPKTRFRLEWATTLNNFAFDESFAVGMINIAAVPVDTGYIVETTQFRSTGNTLDGFTALDEGVAAGPPVIQTCGNPAHPLVGGDELGRRDKLIFTPFLNESTKPFKVAYAYFRYWYSPVWAATDKATLVVTRPGGATVLSKSWEYPFYTRQQPSSNDFDCQRALPNLYKDYVVKIEFPVEVPTCTLTWGIDGNNNAARFAISAFRLDRERPDPDWFLTQSCGGAVYRPDDGNVLVSNGKSFALGDLSNKHGPFRTKTVIDNSLVQYAPNSIIGRYVAFYDEDTGSNGRLQGCCKINRVGSAAPKPSKPATQTAGCVWRNADSQGWVAFRAPSRVDNGATVTIQAKFNNPTEIAGRHAWSINYNGFSLAQQAATTRCSPTMTGNIYGTGGRPRNYIGPTSGSERLGNPPFGGTAGSSRARIGDMSGAFGLLRGTNTKPITFSAGQILLSGPHSVVGRSVVIQSTTGVPIACCTIGMGLIGGSDTKLDYFDRLVNYTGPEPEDLPGFNDLEIPDPDTFLPPGVVQESQPASSFPFWNAARITAVAVGGAAAVLLAAALALGGGGAGAGGVTDPGDGYVAM